MQKDELMELGQVDDHKRVRLVGCTGILCDPNTFPSPQDIFGLPSNAGVKKAASNGQNKQNFSSTQIYAAARTGCAAAGSATT
ncbi:hypothetical protein DPMN_136853 [Dreissena polymorpha]|uniref:Uncharacterized protein n=1 Tax=Dreissena polymorpha TaxID=45954 RepID=A0A9D4G1N3_DREPO|nr:hypothetical protein DPMN_136853 [Dreissena polymorpha]